MIDLNPANKLKITSAIKQPAPSPRYPTNLQRKSNICMIWKRPEENLQINLRTSFIINEHWYIKWNKHKSKIHKKGSNEELEGYLRFKKAINSCEKVLTPNQIPWHDLIQACRGSKPVCPIECGPHTICKQTRRQLAVSTKYTPINTNKQVNN